MSLNISYVPKRIKEYEPSRATEAEVPIIRLRKPSVRTIRFATVQTELEPKITQNSQFNFTDPDGPSASTFCLKLLSHL